MCGIAAFLDPEAGLGPDAAARCIEALRHRGPDGEGSVRIGPTLLVHTRLAIIDVAGGDQPLWSEDRTCAAVVNGEIYNHVALRDELERRGHRFATRSDSEVVVHAYEEWGGGAVDRLNGIFAFALWDARRRLLVAARDPFGVKPLYWWTDGRRVAVASEVGALLAAGLVRPAVDEVALDHYLAWRFVPAPRTLFAGISKLAAASLLVAEEGGVAVSITRKPPRPPLTDVPEEELERELAARLRDAVRRQMMSDVPYGCFLSGGLDSAAVAAVMAAAQTDRTKTFTIGFPGHGDTLDERDAALSTARALGTDHRDTEMIERDFAEEVALCVRRLEEPCGAPSAPAALQLSRFAAQSVKVVLSGQGADEPLGGYQRHQAAAALRLVGGFPAAMAPIARAAGVALARNERIRRAGGLLSAPPGLERLLAIFEMSDARVRARLRDGPAEEAAAERATLAASVLSDLDGRDDALEQALYLDTHLFLPDSLLLYGDKMSMASSLEQRVPFLDVELMSFVERLPARLRLRRLRRKALYRRAIAGLVPAGALARPKHGFSTPYERWLRASLGVTVERAFATRPALGAVIDPAVVAGLVAEHRAGRVDHKRLLYCLLELAKWHETFIEGDAGALETPSHALGAA